MPEAQFQIEDVSRTPRGWHVRTRLQGAHRVRIAFPPGRRQTGAGQVVQILHPKTENPQRCEVLRQNDYLSAKLVRKPTDKWVRTSAGTVGRVIEVQGGPRNRRYLLDIPGQGLQWVHGRLYPAKEPNPSDSRPFEERADEAFKKGFGYSDQEWEEHKRKSAAEYEKLIGKKSRRKSKRNRNSILGRVGQAALTVLTNRHKGKRRNHGNGAEQLYTEFHGRAPHEVLAHQEYLMKSGTYAALGEMGELWLYPVRVVSDYPTTKVMDEDGRIAKPSISWAPDEKVKLAFDGERKQLYLVGGNQKLPLEFLERLGLQADKRWIPLGECYALCYYTEKNFDGFSTIGYVHELGEETGERPQCVYDSETERILFVGGAYSIADWDEQLKASPGIVN